MEAMVNHGKEKIISLDWFEKKIKLKEKNLEAKSMGHVEIIADHYIFFFFPSEFFWVTCQSHQFQMCKGNLSQKLHKWLLVSTINVIVLG